MFCSLDKINDKPEEKRRKDVSARKALIISLEWLHAN